MLPMSDESLAAPLDPELLAGRSREASGEDAPSIVLLETLLESLADGVFAFDRNGRIIYWSPSLERLTGRDAASAMDQPASRVLGKITSKIADSGNQTISGLITTGPESLPVRITVVQALGAGGVRLGKVCAVTDMRGEWNARAVNIQSQALANLGKSVSWAVHQIRNPLGASLGFTDLLARDLANSKSAPLLNKVREGLREIDHRIGEILSYARPKPMLFEENDLAAMIRQVVETIDARFPDHQNIEVSSPLKLSLVCDCRQLVHALENLIVNAIEAAGQDGRVQVVLQSTGLPGEETRMCLTGNHPATVRLLIRNSKSTTDPDLIANMFEPFASSKTGGTGLGLPLAKRIVQMHLGDIEAVSAGGWTTFVLTLPREITAERKVKSSVAEEVLERMTIKEIAGSLAISENEAVAPIPVLTRCDSEPELNHRQRRR